MWMRSTSLALLVVVICHHPGIAAEWHEWRVTLGELPVSKIEKTLFDKGGVCVFETSGGYVLDSLGTELSQRWGVFSVSFYEARRSTEAQKSRVVGIACVDFMNGTLACFHPVDIREEASLHAHQASLLWSGIGTVAFSAYLSPRNQPSLIIVTAIEGKQKTEFRVESCSFEPDPEQHAVDDILSTSGDSWASVCYQGLTSVDCSDGTFSKAISALTKSNATATAFTRTLSVFQRDESNVPATVKLTEIDAQDWNLQERREGVRQTKKPFRLPLPSNAVSAFPATKGRHFVVTGQDEPLDSFVEGWRFEPEEGTRSRLFSVAGRFTTAIPIERNASTSFVVQVDTLEEHTWFVCVFRTLLLAIIPCCQSRIRF